MGNQSTFDAETFKAATRDQWDSSAQGWSDQSPQIRRWLEAATGVMLDMAGVKPGSRVLDVAAGAGDQTLDIAARVGPDGYVLATDISPRILKFAREKAMGAGYTNVETLAVDGEKIDVEAASFDAAVCRLGLMFFPDPGRGLKGMFAALKPGGRAGAMVFSMPENNPCIGVLLSTALKHAGLPPRDPNMPGGLLSLGRPGLIDTLFKDAGFSDVRTTTLAAPFRLPSVSDYMDFIKSSAGPVLEILSDLGDKAREAAWAEIEDRLSAFDTPEGWVGPNELLVTAGRR